MRRNRQKEKTPDASGHMAAAPGVCCYLFVLVCEIEFLAVIVRIRHTFQLGKGLLGQRPHIPVHTRHGCGDLAYRPASVCVVVHTDQIFFFHGKVHHSSYLQFIFLGSGRRLFRAGGLFAVGKLLADRWPGLANTHITALIFVNHGKTSETVSRGKTHTAGYPDVQSFATVYHKSEKLIQEYNEELREWENRTQQKQEKPLEQPKKVSVLEKLYRYQQEGRQQPKRSVKKKSIDRER